MTTRRSSPLAGRKPTRDDLPAFATSNPDALQDVLPDPASGRRLRLLIVGINPGLWTAAVNAPFARPGNRFWASLHRAGMTARRVDASRGLDQEDEDDLLARGIGITNLIGRATVRADELGRAELREGADRLRERVRDLWPAVVAIAGITAYRTAFRAPAARIGRQDTAALEGWPGGVGLWVVHQPSGLNAHATVETLADHWREVARDAGVPPSEEIDLSARRNSG